MEIADITERVREEIRGVRVDESENSLHFYFNPNGYDEHHKRFPLGRITRDGESLLFDSSEYDKTRESFYSKIASGERIKMKGNNPIGKRVNVVYGETFGKLLNLLRSKYSTEKIDKHKTRLEVR